MNKYYKFVNETAHPLLFKGWAENNGFITANPDESVILSLGYKPMIVEDMPEDTTLSYSPVWSEADDSIVQSWVGTVTDREIINIIEGVET